MTSTYRTDATRGLPSRQKRNGLRLIAQWLVCAGLPVPEMLPLPMPDRSPGRRTCDAESTCPEGSQSRTN